MTRPTKLIKNCTTGEEQIVELTDEEIAVMQETIAISEQNRLEREALEVAKAEARASALAKLTALGLTEDEAKAIAG